MRNPAITLVMKDYDYLAPLACGDVEAEGVPLRLDRDTVGALDRTLADASIDVGEMSFSRHVLRLADGNHTFVGLPFFAYRGFQHRCLFVLRGGGLNNLKQLKGKRIGTNEWPASGNVWTRALLRDQGMPISSIHWWIGPVDDLKSPGRPQGNLPPWVQLAPADRTLHDMLLVGELDALTCPRPPKAFFDADGLIVRLYPNYRLGLYTAFFTIDASREDVNWVLDLIEKVAKDGHMDSLVLGDTMGVCTPQAIEYFVRKTKQRINKPLEAHFPNDFGLAVANTLTALACGVEVAYTAICGTGERSGSAALYVLWRS